ncbi:MAG: dihydroorotate dehydrogenase [Deltaproteobacteria bacterium]|nr:dihydroorotate dehydrogenase [Deltaproteobacteria bacterium]
MTASKKPDLSWDLNGLEIKNPVITASGTFGYGAEKKDFVDLNRLGGIVTKGISLKERKGNPMPRIYETPQGMLNSIGLQNCGVDRFIEEKMPFLGKLKASVWVNIYGQKADDYVELAARLSEVEGVDVLEVNCSCPNVKEGGIEFGRSGASVKSLTKKVKKASSKKIVVKLSPNVSDICEIAKAAEDGGADGISLINTIRGMAIDIKKKRPVLATKFGGLSGPAIKPVALAMVWQVFECVKIPVIGMGGIMSVADVIEFIMAGASAVQVGTANFLDPGVSGKLVGGLYDYCAENRLKTLSSIRGLAHAKP